MKNKFYLEICFVLLFCFASEFIRAQGFETGKGKAIIYFKSETPVIVRLDTSLIKQSSTPLNLKEGKYIVRAWAPHKQLFIDTITIKENKTTFVTQNLKNTAEYNNYYKQLNNYRTEKIVTEFVSYPIIAIYCVYASNEYNKNKKIMNQHYQNCQVAQNGYENSISVTDINMYKKQYSEEKANYEHYLDKNNKLSKTATIIIPSALVLSAGMFFAAKLIKKPAKYTETPLLTLNDVYILKESYSTCSLGVRLNIRK